jgi:FMN phosphatase YigB (HAD superfamily)
MKNIIVVLCLLPALLSGMVFESGQMKEILPYVTEETWVLVDLDNTLIESSLQLGSAQWRDHVREKARGAGYDKKGGEEILDQFWLFVQPFIPVRLVDPETAQTIDRLHRDNVVVIGLTAREPKEIVHTQRQISSTGVSFAGPKSQSGVLPTPFPGLYQNGVIYCGDNIKSEALLAFFQHVGATPKKVIFVDDKAEQVAGLEKTLEDRGIEFVGIRFSGADARVESFDGAVADFQFALLPLIVSDEEYLIASKKHTHM